MRLTLTIVAATAGLLGLSAAAAYAATPSPYFEGFESVGGDGWDSGAVATPSGTIPASSGSFYGTASPGAYTWWGGDTDEFLPYDTSIDVYLDTTAGYANDTRIDFTSAIYGSDGSHQRDFAFNFGFYDSLDATGPGAGTDRFIFSASNNTGRANSNPKNPGRDPVATSTIGWHTLEHQFRDDGTGVLEVTMNLYGPSKTLLNTWVLSDPSDTIPAEVGGNGYGWFSSMETGTLAIDNAELRVSAAPVPVPGAGIAGLAMMGLLAAKRRRRV